MRVIILYVLLFLLTSCFPPSDISVAISSSTHTPAAAPLVKPSLTPMVETVERHLDPQGPWIFAYNEYWHIPPYFLNLDGSGYFPLEASPIPIMFNSCPNPANASSSNGYKVQCPQEYSNYELQVVNDSDGSLLRVISLIGEQARQVIEDYVPPTEIFDSPPFPPVTFSVGKYLWSPDGYYLAFVGAMDGPSGDIYIYEPEHDRIRRLTFGSGQTEIMGWSPDSRSIVHVSGDEYNIINSLVGKEVWNVDIDGNITLLYQLSANGSSTPIISDWIDEDTFITFRPTFEGNPIDLLLVNIVSKEFTPIDALNFRWVLFDSRNQRLLINWGPSRGPGDGVYEYNVDNGLLSDFASDMEIEEILPLVPFYYASSFEAPTEYSRLLVDKYGEIVSKLNCQQAESKKSPDGRFILMPDSASIELIDPELNTIRRLDDVILAHWLPDSSGFYAYAGEYDLYETNTFQVYLYSEVNDWQPVLVNILSIYGCFTFVSP